MSVLRLRAGEAMALLGVRSRQTFHKIIDACPQVRHRLPGEKQDRYLREELLKLVSPQANGPRCVAGRGGSNA